MKRWIAITLYVSGIAAAQSLDTLSANTQQLQVQVNLDQTTYFPGEAAAISIAVTNPTSGALLVAAPFNTGSGCLALFLQPPSGPPSPLGADDPCSGPVAGAAYPTTTIGPGAQKTIALNSYDNMFDSGAPAMSVPSAAGSYLLTYGYASAGQAGFNIVLPHLDTAAVVQMQDETAFDAASGDTTTQHAYMHVFSVRWNNQSYICVTVSPVASGAVITADPNGNFIAPPGVFKRIATSQNPVVSISATVGITGILAIQWQDTTGTDFTGTFTVQYELVTDSEPDGAGWVFPRGAYFSPGTTVNLTAVPAPGFSFSNWSGDPVVNANSASTTITMSNEFNVTANFVANSQTTPVNVTPQTSTSTSNPSIDSTNHLILESVTITNTGGQYLTGPISVALTSLSTGFTLENATGTYNGSPYIQLFNYGVLAPGASVTVFLQFSIGPTAIVRFTPAIYTGL
jgi:hypothetical protein